jgi:hyperosmotically inducible protein
MTCCFAGDFSDWHSHRKVRRTSIPSSLSLFLNERSHTMRKTRIDTLFKRKLIGALTIGAIAATLAPAGAGADATPARPESSQELPGDPRADIEQEFARLDADGSGAISLAEFERGGGKSEAFKQSDANRDGRLTRDEFAQASSRSDWMKVGEFVDDTWITTKIKAMLLKDAPGDSLDVKVETEDGVVQLSGFVDSGLQASRAAEIASSVKGVKRVINDLVVRKS